MFPNFAICMYVDILLKVSNKFGNHVYIQTFI